MLLVRPNPARDGRLKLDFMGIDMNAKDYRVELRVKNNLLLKKIEDEGFVSISDFCRKNNFSVSSVTAYANFRKAPINKNGSWSDAFSRIAKSLRCLPEDICPPQHLRKILKKNKASFEMDAGDVALLLTGSSEDAAPLIDHILRDESAKIINEMLLSLTPREERVLRMRYGLTEDGGERTLEEVGKEFSVIRERIRQIEAKALRKLKHPVRSRNLRMAAEAFGVFCNSGEVETRHYIPEWKKGD